ncbi:MAG: DUF2125 domain-containing protein [Alphaproteobacteria bacterium]|nr:DUF2125 domain-containing protein [Alphaproteobacteria bacterium]MBU0798084.1 DUF2125 domain-containing protein [Alphaproteobacteria bacterium]MBU0888784.1 DUF2125 domain-containing protein [Alphaproteobacteria bacterium]MBU1812497.1 DUF2125 domain-containing protein [Alphaproteobacteria bacterium]
MRRLVIGFFALLLVLTGAYSAYWYIMADRLRDGIAGWAATAAAQGMEAGWTGFTLSGFPFAFRARFEAPSIQAEGAATPWSWRSSTLLLEARPWNLRHIRFEAPEAQTLHFGLLTDRTRFDIVGSSGVIGLDSRYQAASIDADLGALTASDSGKAVLASAAGLDIGLARNDAALDIRLSARDVEPRMAMDLPVQGAAQIDLTASLLGPLPQQSGEAALAAWRDAGGTLEIRHVLLDWQPIRLEGDGTLALDRALQPIGAFSAEIEGHDKLLDGMAQMGLVRPDDARMGQVALGLLTREGRQGRPVLKAPVSLQDGFVFLGPLRLARMPRIVWR